MIFHGVNAVSKLTPFMPTTGEFDAATSLNDDDIKFFKKWGFNFVRLGVMWEGHEVAKGKYDTSYLDKLSTLINTLGENGIYTQIDLHQDALSRVTCGEGVPTWYTRDVKQKCSDFTFGLPLYWAGVCKPMSELIDGYDQNVDTPIEKCLKNDFSKYSMTPQTMDAAERLYTPGTEMHQAFLNHWDGVSKHFADNKYVVGYDLINEPIPANVFNDLNKILKPDVELQGLYQSTSDVIRKNDKNKIIFYSASQEDIIPVFSGYIRTTGFTETPSKGKYQNIETMVDHVYCDAILGNDWGKDESKREAQKKTCYSYIQRRIEERVKNSKALNNSVIYNEFGACSDTDTCATELTYVTE